MSKTPSKRKPNATLRWVLMLVGVVVVFGGVFYVKSYFAGKQSTFFDNMPQPAVAVSSYVAKTQRWSDNGVAVGTFVAINGTAVTTEAGVPARPPGLRRHRAGAPELRQRASHAKRA